MRILLVGSSVSFNELCRMLQAHEHQVVTAQDLAQAAAHLNSMTFDCILVDTCDVANLDNNTLYEIRNLIMASSVVLMTDVPHESLIERALSEGSITLVADADIEKAVTHRDSSLPLLVLGRGFNPQLIERLTRSGLRAIAAATLPLTLNTMADGWCDVVLLDVEIPGLTPVDKVALFGPLTPQLLAVLAAGDYEATPGIPCVHQSREPEKILSILEHTVDSRPAPCGWVASLRHRPLRQRDKAPSTTKA